MSITPKQTIKGTVAATQSARGVLKDIPSLDNTLTKEDYAADAKATGEAISQALTDANTYTDTHTRSNAWMPTAEEVGARPDTWVPTAADVGARPNTWLPTPADIGAASMDYAKTISRKNLLDNWYFANRINQRGQTEYTTPWAYTIDRWMTGGTVTIRNQGISFTHLLYQKLDDYVVNAIAGKTVTVSVLTAYGVLASYTATFSADSYVEVTVNGVTILFGGAIPGHGLNFPTVTIGGDQYLVAIKLELGTEQTLAHQENGVWVLNEIPNYAEELAKCQRYALFGELCGIPTNKWYGAVGFEIPTPVTMRPNVSLAGTYIINSTDGPGNNISNTLVSAVTRNNSVYVYVSVDPSDVAKACSLHFNVGNGITADL